MVPNVALLETTDASLEDDIIDEDEGCAECALKKRETLGLTLHASDSEKILKYGSTFAARLVK